MEIGVPKEVKDRESRVGLSPSSVRVLSEAGHRIFVQTQAGVGSGFSDDAYERAGATIAPDAKTVWARELVVKVKEPLPSEFDFLQAGHILFTYLHLAADRALTERLLQSKITAIAYETVELGDRSLPLLTPMSRIAGRLAIQFGAHFLESHNGGRGVLLGGVPGVAPGRIAILGGGIVGTEAAKIAIGMGAHVQILDINVERLAYLETLFGSRVELLYSEPTQIERVVSQADLLVGAVLVPGRRAPILVPRSLVRQMAAGAVIVDVAVDQGGCVETLHPTSHTHPTYTEENVLHYGVPNMPGAVPRTATLALNNSTLPYVRLLADFGIQALDRSEPLAKGLNIDRGRIVHPAVREVFSDLAN